MVIPKLKSLTIKNILPGLPERGKIKIGKKGEERTANGTGRKYRLPVKIDHFLITTLEKDTTDNFIVDEKMHTILGGEEIKDIPVYLIYDDISLNFPSRYTAYKGKDLVGVSDGETRHWYSSVEKKWITDEWPIDFDLFTQTSDVKWRINATLSVMIDKAEAVGGVWKLRTTSYNAVQGILSSLTLIKSCTGGALAGIPLMLTLRPKTVSTPDGGGMVAYIPGLEFRGTMSALRDTGLKIMLENQKHTVMIERIEDEARRLISISNATDFSDPDDREDLAIGNEAEVNAEQARQQTDGKGKTVVNAEFTDLPEPIKENAVVPPITEVTDLADKGKANTKAEPETKVETKAETKTETKVETKKEPLKEEKGKAKATAASAPATASKPAAQQAAATPANNSTAAKAQPAKSAEVDLF